MDKPIPTTTVKRCCRCKQERPIGEFTKDRQAPDGLNRRCRSCKNALSREYRASSERRKEYERQWVANNREAVNKYAREWRAANHEAHLAAKRRWRERNPERGAEYYEANREASFERVRRRRALQYGATIGPINLAALWTGECALCHKVLDREISWPNPSSKSLDHIVPLSKGGTHEQSNLQWAHLVCNISKGAKLADP